MNTSAGIIICATDKLKEAGGFDNAVGSYEKFLQHLKPMNNILTIPIVIIGLDAFDKYSIIDKKVILNKNKLPKKDEDKINKIQHKFKSKGYDFIKNADYSLDDKLIQNIPLISKSNKIILYKPTKSQKELVNKLKQDNWITKKISKLYSTDQIDDIIEKLEK